MFRVSYSVIVVGGVDTVDEVIATPSVGLLVVCQLYLGLICLLAFQAAVDNLRMKKDLPYTPKYGKNGHFHGWEYV